jgi:hypothetical protein
VQGALLASWEHALRVAALATIVRTSETSKSSLAAGPDGLKCGGGGQDAGDLSLTGTAFRPGICRDSGRH